MSTNFASQNTTFAHSFRSTALSDMPAGCAVAIGMYWPFTIPLFFMISTESLTSSPLGTINHVEISAIAALHIVFP